MPDDTAPAWPDPNKPGVPGPSGAYVLRRKGGFEFPAWWSGPTDHWVLRGGASMKADAVAEIGTTLVGPCLTPTEVQGREAAAWAAGAEAMREASLVTITTLYDFHDAPSLYVAYEAIEDLPLPPMPTQGGAGDE